MFVKEKETHYIICCQPSCCMLVSGVVTWWTRYCQPARWLTVVITSKMSYWHLSACQCLMNNAVVTDNRRAAICYHLRRPPPPLFVAVYTAAQGCLQSWAYIQHSHLLLEWPTCLPSVDNLSGKDNFIADAIQPSPCTRIARRHCVAHWRWAPGRQTVGGRNTVDLYCRWPHTVLWTRQCVIWHHRAAWWFKTAARLAGALSGQCWCMRSAPDWTRRPGIE